MGDNHRSKNDKIPVQKVKETERVSVQLTHQLLEAEFEVKLLIRSLCSEYAYTIPSLANYLKARAGFPASEGLSEFLKIRSTWYLEKLIDKVIYAEHSSGGYGSNTVNEFWKKTERPVWKIFHKTLYYYDNPDFVNPYILEDTDLPLHINKKWEDDKLREVYLRRMKDV